MLGIRLEWFKYKPHQIGFIFYSTFPNPFFLPLSSYVYMILIVTLLRDGWIYGVLQSKSREPTPYHVLQPVFLGTMLSIIAGMITKLVATYIQNSDTFDDLTIKFVVFLTIGILFFPFILGFIFSVPLYLPYIVAYKLGDRYGASGRNLEPDEMRDFLQNMKAEKKR